MVTQHALPTTFDDTASGWQGALYAFLAEKERRSGSMRTVQSYSRMLQDFFGRTTKPPDKITPAEVFTWRHGIGLSGKRPSSVTIGARIACLSSFYRFLIRMDIVASNPCERLERPKIVPGVARGLSAEDIRRLLDIISDTPQGRRDRAIILVLALTGRQRAEVIGMHEGWRHHPGEGDTFLHLSRQGRKDGAAGAPDAGIRCHPRWPHRLRTRPINDGGGGIALAVPPAGRGDHERDILRPPAALPAASRAPVVGRARLSPQRRQTATRRRGDRRGGVPFSRPQQPRYGDDLLAQT